MIKIEKTKVTGWDSAIRGMRNSYNSWDKSDTRFDTYHDIYEMGANDLVLMQRLVASGADHAKFMRMIVVYADINAPLYWWKEYDTYKVGTVANSCSTMHKIADKPFETSDFSCEHLDTEGINTFSRILWTLNRARAAYLSTKDKEIWYQMIQLLPSSYNQRRTVMLNYQVLRNIYFARRNHRLGEWYDFCNWIKTLPYSELITEDAKNE